VISLLRDTLWSQCFRGTTRRYGERVCVNWESEGDDKREFKRSSLNISGIDFSRDECTLRRPGSYERFCWTIRTLRFSLVLGNNSFRLLHVIVYSYNLKFLTRTETYGRINIRVSIVDFHVVFTPTDKVTTLTLHTKKIIITLS
jgi:hypothetical protein